VAADAPAAQPSDPGIRFVNVCNDSRDERGRDDNDGETAGEETADTLTGGGLRRAAASAPGVS
jgi:hypothetical protein